MENRMRASLKLFLTVLFLSCLLGGAAAALCLFLLPERDTAERTVAIVFIALYAFFLLPDLMLAVEYFASRADRIPAQRSFWIGYYFGDLIAIVLFLLAPISGTIWFLLTFAKLIGNRKRDKSDTFEDL